MEKAAALKRDLLNSIGRLGDCLPPNTLDQLIDELGGPDCVAEVQHYLFLILFRSIYLYLQTVSFHAELPYYSLTLCHQDQVICNGTYSYGRLH